MEMGGNPCQIVDLQKLLPGTINLPGVFAVILGTFWRRSGGLGSRSDLGPLLAGKLQNAKAFTKVTNKVHFPSLLFVKVGCYVPGRGLLQKLRSYGI
jgi:hypothetical protein